MITPEEVIRIGSLRKPYGTRGEILCNIDVDWAEQVFDPRGTLAPERCIILLIDGILVPFFIDSYRWRQEGLLLHFDENYISPFKGQGGLDLYLLRKDLPADIEDDEIEVIGFTVLDETGKSVGRIADIDDSTANTLIIMEDGTPIPFHEDLLLGIDEEHQTIQLIIPEGLICTN